ncbi:MAG: hypothetical protein AAF717_17805 [Bacteroidota bacterium]
MKNLENLTLKELNQINGGSELTDSIWEAIGYFFGASTRGDIYKHQNHGRTGYF